MAADFTFIAHTAQRHTHEIAVRRFRDRLTKRCFTNPRWTCKTQDRAADFIRTLLHGEIFKNTFLDFFQTEMITVENSQRLIDVLLDA